MTEKDHGQKTRSMFNRITRRYDFLNRLLSAGQDMRWRRKAVYLLGDLNGATVLDLCCGTGDFIEIFYKLHRDSVKIYGVDFSEKMLGSAAARLNAGSKSRIVLCQGDALSLPFSEASVDAVTLGFGIRNIRNRQAALAEIIRVLKPGGRVVIIEPAFPENPIVGWPFKIYFKTIMPFIGGIISGNRRAYKYLHDTVDDFPAPDDFVALMERAGFTEAKAIPQAMGTAIIYFGEKRKITR